MARAIALSVSQEVAGLGRPCRRVDFRATSGCQTGAAASLRGTHRAARRQENPLAITLRLVDERELAIVRKALEALPARPEAAMADKTLRGSGSGKRSAELLLEWIDRLMDEMLRR
jgi:hypothetical protein